MSRKVAVATILVACLIAGGSWAVRRARAASYETVKAPSPGAALVVKGARSCIGDAGNWEGHPEGSVRGLTACTDVVYWGMKEAGIDLQDAVAKDVKAARSAYPSVRAPNLDYRVAPNLHVYFSRHPEQFEKLGSDGDFAPGDVLFVSCAGDGQVDQCEVLTDRRCAGTGQLCNIQLEESGFYDEAPSPPVQVVGHFRLVDRKPKASRS